MTPEGKIKAAIGKVLTSYPESYVFMPVPYGYGQSTVDYLFCHYGKFIGIEAKAPGKHPTARQKLILKRIVDAGGDAFIIDNIEKCHLLRVYLEQVKQNAGSPSQSQTQDGGSPIRGEPRKFIPRSEADAIWERASFASSSSPDRDVPSSQTGVRRTEPNPDALRLVRGKSVQKPEVNISDADSGTARIRPERDGDGQD